MKKESWMFIWLPRSYFIAAFAGLVFILSYSIATSEQVETSGDDVPDFIPPPHPTTPIPDIVIPQEVQENLPDDDWLLNSKTSSVSKRQMEKFFEGYEEIDTLVEDKADSRVERILLRMPKSEQLIRIDYGADFDTEKSRWIQSQGRAVVADEILIIPKNKEAIPVILEDLKSTSLEVRKVSPLGNYISVGFSKILPVETGTLEKIGDLVTSLDSFKDNVYWIQPNHLFAPSSVPNDPKVVNGDQDYLYQIACPAAWDIETNASSVVVAVIDTGMQLDHPDLVANLWTNQNESVNGVDDDGNGVIDDIHGADFGAQPHDGDPSAHTPHGTNVAGIIGAKGNNSIGVAGICWDVQLMPIVFYAGVGGEIAQESGMIDSISYARIMGADVANMSIYLLGGQCAGVAYQIWYASINQPDMIFVTCAGNTGLEDVNYDSETKPVYPACYWYDNIINVANVDGDDELYSSFYGSISVDLAAPGAESYTTDLNSGYTGAFGGTSGAAPMVSGTVALIKSVFPNDDRDDIRRRILNNVDVTTSLTGLLVSNGRLNVAKSLYIWGAGTPVTGQPGYYTIDWMNDTIYDSDRSDGWIKLMGYDLWLYTTSKSTDNILFYEGSEEWILTDETTFPWYYHYNSSTWKQF